MSISRRDLVIWGSCFGAAELRAAVAAEKTPALPSGIGSSRDYTGPLPPSRLGTQHPLKAEERVASSVIDKAPRGPTPMDIARYFIDVAGGVYGTDWVPYASGWPTRWNPVIVTFFKATGTVPSGDVTPWCAAFLNWCYLRATNSAATHSASSGSFRCYGSPTSTPKLGDIVVFRRKDSNDQCMGNGHVGFFVRQTDTAVEVLAGNQIEGHTGCHRVSSTMIAKAGNSLVLHSYRRGPQP
jgi:uncharacterized protein (TIGR02594 family)